MPSQNRLSAASSYFLSLFRIVVALLFGCHGAQKVLGVLGGHRMSLASLPGSGGALELLGGTLILLGLFTRPVAFILSGEMAVAYYRAHASKGLIPIENGGELAVLYCFVFLYMIFSGGGALSLDALVRNKE
jgi:putative oxidoreductase